MKHTVLLTMVLAVVPVFAGCSTANRISEQSPTVSPDGSMLIYQSKDPDTGVYRLHAKYRTPFGWSTPVYLQLANTAGNTGGPFITYDKNSLILTSDQPGGLGNADLWISERQKLVWGKPVNMGAPVNSPGYEGFASLSPDGNTLYFVRECSDKIPYQDARFAIFMSMKAEGRWTEPVRMPAPVNSKWCDFAPVILADGKTLIFSSNRPGGFGGYDLYKCEMMPGGRWSDAVNLGPEINTIHDDRTLAIPPSGDVVYHPVPVDKEAKMYRIAMTRIPETIIQSSVITVSGVVTDSRTGEKSLPATVTIIDMAGGERQTVQCNRTDGSYMVILNRGRVYDVALSCPGYAFHSTKFDLRNTTTFNAVLKDIELDPLLPGERLVLNNLQFRLNSAELLPESRHELERVMELLVVNPGMTLEISGHTDGRGRDNYNYNLSRKRATVVRNYLVVRGIHPDRLKMKAYGADRPLVYNDTRDEKNRRVEMEILSM